jgi:hypothetical protein
MNLTDTVLEDTLLCYIEGYDNSRSIKFLSWNFYQQTVDSVEVIFQSWIIAHSIKKSHYNSTGHSSIVHTSAWLVYKCPPLKTMLYSKRPVYASYPFLDPHIITSWSASSPLIYISMIHFFTITRYMALLSSLHDNYHCVATVFTAGMQSLNVYVILNKP